MNLRQCVHTLLIVSGALIVASCGSGGGGGGDGGGGGGGAPPTVTLPPGNKSTIVAQSTIPVGAAACNGLGGVHVDWGIDTNGNGVLDPSEITGGGDICNGAAGNPGNPGNPGTPGNNDASVRRIVVPGPDAPMAASAPGYTYAVTGIGSTTWAQVVGKNPYVTSTAGSQFFYDAYLLVNSSSAALQVDFAVKWSSGTGTLTAYSGSFVPATPLVNIVDWNGSYGTSTNLLSLTLNAGESKFVIVSNSTAATTVGYTLSLTSYTPATWAAAQAGVSGTATQGNTHVYKVTGLRAGGPYELTLHTANFNHGDNTYLTVYEDANWQAKGTTSMTLATGDSATGDSAAAAMVADSTGSLWPAVGATTVVAGGAFTWSMIPGAEIVTLPLGTQAAGSVNGTSSTYTINTTLGNAPFTVTIGNITSPAVTATITDSFADTNQDPPLACGDQAASTITCTITTADTTITYVKVTVSGVATGATYTIGAMGPSTATGLTLSLIATTATAGFVRNTAPVTYTATGAVNNGFYRILVSALTDPAVTVSITDTSSAPGSGSCNPYTSGQISCTYTAGTSATPPFSLRVTVSGAATAYGAGYSIQAFRPVAQTSISLDGLGTTTAGSVNTTQSTYTSTVWPNTTYSLQVSNATSDAVTVSWADNQAHSGTCDPVVSGALTCSVAIGAETYPITLTVTVNGSATTNGGWYSLRLQ